jgi:hypothetical protein
MTRVVSIRVLAALVGGGLPVGQMSAAVAAVGAWEFAAPRAAAQAGGGVEVR